MSVPYVRHSLMCADIHIGFWPTGIYVNSVCSCSKKIFEVRIIQFLHILRIVELLYYAIMHDFCEMHSQICDFNDPSMYI